MLKGGDQRITFTLICFIAFVAAMLIIYTTVNGSWALSDSAAYLASARSLVRGSGLGYLEANRNFTPLILHPPLYAVMLASFVLINIDPIEGTRWLNAVLIFIFILSTGWLFYRITASRFLALMLCTLLLLYPDIIDSFSGMMTETVFLPIGFSGVLLTIVGIKDKSFKVIYISFALIALSCLTRFTGFAFLFAGVLTILFFFKSLTVVQRLKLATMGVLVSGLPIFFWSVWAASKGAKLGGRGVFIPADMLSASKTYFSQAVLVVIQWLPYPYLFKSFIPLTLKIMALFVFALCVFFVSKALIEKKKKNAAQAHCIIMVIFAMVIFIIVHWGIHYAANVFASPTEISGRLFSPILTALLIILASLLELVALASNHKAIPILFSMGIVLCLITYQYPRVEKYSMNMHESGKGYTANNIRNSELIKIIRDLPASETYVSNEPAMLLFYADKLAYNIYIIPPEKHFIKVIFIARLLASDGESAINIINATKKDCTVTFQNVDGLVADCYSP